MKHVNEHIQEGFSLSKINIDKAPNGYNSKSYFNGFGLKRVVYTIFATIGVVCTFSSCSLENKNHTFQSPKEAIEEYRCFLANLKQEKTSTIEGLNKSVLDWKALGDSVWSSIRRDTTQRVHYYPESHFHQVHDSIKEEMYRLSFSQPRSFKDVVSLKTATSPYSNDTTITHAVAEASVFFDELDNVPTLKVHQSELLTRYEKFLTKTIALGINDKEQLMNFIREEDVFFRAFLNHLHKMEHTSMASITHKTEDVVAKMFKDNARLQPKDAIVYMSMRTNRRLLLNAQTCIRDIRAQRVKSDQQLTAYLFMTIQPYLAIDEFGMAVLSQKQRKLFEQIATDTPTAINAIYKLRSEDAKMHTDFPKLLLKLHLSTF